MPTRQPKSKILGSHEKKGAKDKMEKGNRKKNNFKDEG